MPPQAWLERIRHSSIDYYDVIDRIWRIYFTGECHDPFALAMMTKPALRILRSAIMWSGPVHITIQCTDRPRRVTVKPDGRLSLEHNRDEIAAMRALAVLGEPVCPCLKLVDQLPTRYGLPPNIDGKLDQGRGRILRSIHSLNAALGSARHYVNNVYLRMVREGFIDRWLALKKLCDTIQAAAPQDYYVSPSTYIRSKMDLTTGSRYYAAVNTGVSRAPTDSGEVIHVALGLGALLRSRRSTWYARDPDGQKHLIVIEAREPFVWRSQEYRDCIILLFRSGVLDLRKLIRRVLVDREGNIVARVIPARWVFAYARSRGSFRSELAPGEFDPGQGDLAEVLPFATKITPVRSTTTLTT